LVRKHPSASSSRKHKSRNAFCCHHSPLITPDDAQRRNVPLSRPSIG
jgi:hypothetical protein